MTSVLYNPLIVSARALSYESPTLPTDESTPLRPALRVTDRQILTAAVAVMNQPLRPGSRPQCLLQRIQHQVRTQRIGDAPTDNATGKDINDEGDIDEARQVATKVMSATHNWFGRVAVNSRFTRSAGRSSSIIADGGLARTAAYRTPQAQRPHQALHGTACHGKLFAVELAPDLACTVDAEVLVIDALDLTRQFDVTSCPRR